MSVQITTAGIDIKSSKKTIVYRIIIPKRELDESVDIANPIENAIDEAVRKVMD